MFQSVRVADSVGHEAGVNLHIHLCQAEYFVAYWATNYDEWTRSLAIESRAFASSKLFYSPSTQGVLGFQGSLSRLCLMFQLHRSIAMAQIVQVTESNILSITSRSSILASTDPSSYLRLRLLTIMGSCLCRSISWDVHSPSLALGRYIFRLTSAARRRSCSAEDMSHTGFDSFDLTYQGACHNVSTLSHGGRLFSQVQTIPEVL
jgi:hypothetical protein